MKFFVCLPVVLVPFQLVESSSAFARAVGESLTDHEFPEAVA